MVITEYEWKSLLQMKAEKEKCSDTASMLFCKLVGEVKRLDEQNQKNLEYTFDQFKRLEKALEDIKNIATGKVKHINSPTRLLHILEIVEKATDF